MGDEQLILAIDQGTTSSRAVLVDRTGAFVDVAQEEIDQIYPQSGWVNQDPENIWEVTLRVVRQVLDREEGRVDRVAAIGITNQRETTVLWDRATGKAVAPGDRMAKSPERGYHPRDRSARHGRAVPGDHRAGAGCLFLGVEDRLVVRASP